MAGGLVARAPFWWMLVAGAEEQTADERPAGRTDGENLDARILLRPEAEK